MFWEIHPVLYLKSWTKYKLEMLYLMHANNIVKFSLSLSYMEYYKLYIALQTTLPALWYDSDKSFGWVWTELKVFYTML